MEISETESNNKSFDLQVEPGSSSSNLARADIEWLHQQIDQVKKDEELPKITRRKRLRALNQALKYRRPKTKNKTEKQKKDHQQRMKKCRSKLSEPEKSSLEEQDEEDDPFNDEALMEMSTHALNRILKDNQISGARQAEIRLQRKRLKQRGKKISIELLVKRDKNVLNEF